jgi:hypothetical protein
MASSNPPSGGDREVLASLPNSRPTRRSAKRDGGGRGRAAGAAAERPAKPARASAGAAPKGRAKAGAKANQGAARTTAKRPAAPTAAPVPPAGYATPRSDDDRPRGADLVTTAVQAAGELAHIGIAAGGRALKSALQRLPRP